MEKILDILAKWKKPDLPMDGKAVFSDNGGETTYLYTTLPRLLETVVPPLRKLGIEILTTISGDYLEVSLVHGDELVCSGMTLDYKWGPKNVGAQITSYRRQIITTLLGYSNDIPEEKDELTALKGDIYAYIKEIIQENLELNDFFQKAASQGIKLEPMDKDFITWVVKNARNE